MSTPVSPPVRIQASDFGAGDQIPTSDSPTRQNHAGDYRRNTDPAHPGTLGWLCTVTGNPGTWVAVAAGLGGTVTSVTGTAPISVSPSSPNPNVTHDNSGVSPGVFNNVVVDAKGHVTDGSIAPDPYVLCLSYGPLGDGPPNASGSDGTLPILAGGEGVPVFWLKPSTDINNVSAVGTVSDQFIVEWPIDDTYARAALSVFIRNLSLSATVGTVTMTIAITKNGVATATGILFPATETDTLHTDTQFVSFVPGDLVGVRVNFSANYASGTMLCTARVKLT